MADKVLAVESNTWLASVPASGSGNLWIELTSHCTTHSRRYLCMDGSTMLQKQSLWRSREDWIDVFAQGTCSYRRARHASTLSTTHCARAVLHHRGSNIRQPAYVCGGSHSRIRSSFKSFFKLPLRSVTTDDLRASSSSAIVVRAARRLHLAAAALSDSTPSLRQLPARQTDLRFDPYVKHTCPIFPAR